jgi:hypothetical protein
MYQLTPCIDPEDLSLYQQRYKNLIAYFLRLRHISKLQSDCRWVQRPYFTVSTVPGNLPTLPVPNVTPNPIIRRHIVVYCRDYTSVSVLM